MMVELRCSIGKFAFGDIVAVGEKNGLDKKTVDSLIAEGLAVEYVEKVKYDAKDSLNKIAELTAEVERLSAENTKLVEEIAKLTADVSTLVEEKNTLTAEVEKSKAKK